MFGCGKFDEITMLMYIEQIAGDKIDKNADAQMESHLMECDLCMKEVAEMTRIEAMVDGGEAVKIPAIRSVFVSLKNGIIDKFSSVAIQAGMVKALETRSAETWGTEQYLELIAQTPPARIRIIPVNNEKVWISIDSDELHGKYIELKKFSGNETAPAYYKRANSRSLTIKGISEGKYELRFGDNRIKINIKSY
jgi:hypothetical protein